MKNPLENKKTEADSELLELIRDYYTPQGLLKALCEMGQIPQHSLESHVGVGFIDIADYTYLSKFLSPKENQIVLNGLYTAFQIVLERHGGYMNKIEGDSMMFQFDDVLDRRLRGLGKEERLSLIARELFFTCVEMQRICILFNHADDRFLDSSAPPEAHEALADAFGIINNLRKKNDAYSTLFAFYQIRIRIGANIGEVTIGNFGPYGSKHWDVIGLPVINAKRMESTAPVGGLRISRDFSKYWRRTGSRTTTLPNSRRRLRIKKASTALSRKRSSFTSAR
jgi:class 3 adenylate cyclase